MMIQWSRTIAIVKRRVTLPCDDPVAQDDVNCIVAATGKQGGDAADEQEQGKPGDWTMEEISNLGWNRNEGNKGRTKFRGKLPMKRSVGRRGVVTNLFEIYNDNLKIFYIKGNLPLGKQE